MTYLVKAKVRKGAIEADTALAYPIPGSFLGGTVYCHVRIRRL
jgi:hypothetical protein